MLDTKEKKNCYSIKEIAERTNLAPHVLRYYEKEGLLPDIERTQSGIRRYTDRDLEWLGLICCLKNTGMSLQQIKIFVDLSKRGDKTLKQRCDLLADHRKKVEAHMEETKRHLEKVSHKLAHFTAQYEKSLNEREIKNIKKSEV